MVRVRSIGVRKLRSELARAQDGEQQVDAANDIFAFRYFFSTLTEPVSLSNAYVILARDVN